MYICTSLLNRRLPSLMIAFVDNCNLKVVPGVHVQWLTGGNVQHNRCHKLCTLNSCWHCRPWTGSSFWHIIPTLALQIAPAEAHTGTPCIAQSQLKPSSRDCSRWQHRCGPCNNHFDSASAAPRPACTHTAASAAVLKVLSLTRCRCGVACRAGLHAQCQPTQEEGASTTCSNYLVGQADNAHASRLMSQTIHLQRAQA